jgi:hypothetical protein
MNGPDAEKFCDCYAYAMLADEWEIPQGDGAYKRPCPSALTAL